MYLETVIFVGYDNMQVNTRVNMRVYMRVNMRVYVCVNICLYESIVRSTHTQSVCVSSLCACVGEHVLSVCVCVGEHRLSEHKETCIAINLY